jgi:sugar O-acyltransferase (sialic acid O-acetyltransferase NeuD family)
VIEQQLLAVYGNSGFGREVMPLINQVEIPSNNATQLFIDDKQSDELVNGYDVWSYERFASEPAVKKSIVIAIADGRIRHKLAEKCRLDGLNFFSVTSAQHVRMDNCEIGEGAIFSPYSVLTSNIQIGTHFHCNIYSYVAHDCIIGDFVTFAPSVKCNGNIVIEDFAYIGTGAIIKQGTPDKPLRIGAGAVVGMGAVVTKDVAPGETVIGNPARPMQR